MTLRPSVCALDCPDTCALLVQVDASGRGTKLRGDPSHPITRGFLCGKVARYLEREYHPDRLLYPLRRIAAKGDAVFQRITWTEALDQIAERLGRIGAAHGPESILPYSYAGTMGLVNGAGMDRRFFHRLGASRLERTICASAGGEALLRSQGVRLGTEPEQFSQSKLIIAWGANILGTNVHLWPAIVEARRRGARFFVIDPFRNRTGDAADLHFPINPGSDLALALGLLHIILRERWHDPAYIARYSDGFADLESKVRAYPPDRVAAWTGLRSDQIELLAREYALTKPAVIRLNYGVQRSESGGSAVRAIAALPVVTGSWQQAGGGLQLTTSGAFAFNTAALEMPELQLRSPLGRQARKVNMSSLGSALLHLQNPPIHGLVVYNSNPAAIAPHQSMVKHGLLRQDLYTVVLEHFLTDTARYADLVLPATTFLEHTDLYLAYGHYYVQLARPALPAPGEAKSNADIFRLLAERMGWSEPCFRDSDDDLIRAALRSSSPYLAGITLERLDTERFIRLNVSEKGTPFLPFANGNFATPTSRFQFGAETLSYHPPHESRHSSDSALLAQFPLELITPKGDAGMNSTFGMKAEAAHETSYAWVHPDDAAARAITDGDPILVFNARGQVELLARVSSAVKPGLVCVRSVGWSKSAGGNGRAGINALTSERLTDFGGGPTFYNCMVQIKRAGDLKPPHGPSSSHPVSAL